MAERIGARVSVIHVVHPWVPPAGSEEAYQFDANGERIETARSLLHRLLDKTCQRVGALHVHVVIGRPVDGIIQFARCMNSDLIVMATHGERGFKPLFLSATTEQASRRAPCPVLAVPEAVLLRGEAAESVVDLTLCRRILVPTDYSADSAAALRYAAALAPQNGSEIHVLNFSEQAPPRDVIPAHAPRFDRDEDLRPAARERLRDWAHSHLQSTKNLKFLVCPGKPSAYLLLREAGLVETDLIILSPRRHVWAERLQRNNKTDAILRNAPCPVLSLRTETRIAGR